MVHALSVCGALVPLPGTLLATMNGSNTILQYDAMTGQSLGSLQVQVGGQPATYASGIAVLNGSIYVSAHRQGLSDVIGILDTTSGSVSVLRESFGVPPAMDAKGDMIVVGGGGAPSVSLRDPNTFDEIALIPYFFAPGTFPDFYFMGVAATSTGFVSTYNNFWYDIQFWTNTGTYDGRRTVNAPLVNPIIPDALDYDEETGAFWLGLNGGSGSAGIRRYGPTSPNPEWTVTFPGQVIDIAYTPIPAPGFAGLFTAAVILTTRRRR